MGLTANFKDDILSEVNTKRKYKMTNNPDGTISLEDVTEYQQLGTMFGAKEVNEIISAILENERSAASAQETSDSIKKNALKTLNEVKVATQPGFFVDALAAKEGFFPQIQTYKPILMAGLNNRPINYTEKTARGVYIRIGDLIFFDSYFRGNITESGEFATVSLPVEPKSVKNLYSINIITSLNCTTKPVSSACSIQYEQRSVINIWSRVSDNSYGVERNYWKTGTDQIFHLSGFYLL